MKYTLLAALLLASTAAAQDVTPTFHAEGAAQVMLSSALRDRFDWGGAGTARAGLEVIGPLAIQTSFGTAIFPVRNQAPGNLFAFELGLRGFFRVGDAWVGGPFVDANAGIGMTGDLVRFLFDIGAGWDFFAVPAFGFGPVVRYQQIVDGTASAHVMSFGVNFTIRIDLSHPPPPAPPPAEPETDTDADGVFDSQDRCPNVSEDTDGHEDDDGCPDPDNDSDGFADAEDRCPDSAENRNGIDDEDGCPDEAPAAVPEQVEELPQTVLFRLGSDNVGARNRASLDEVCRLLQEQRPNVNVRVVGHADEQGTEAGNHRLGAARAGAVAEQLVLCGVAAERIESYSYGDTRPACNEVNEDCHTRNRRVTFEILERE